MRWFVYDQEICLVDKTRKIAWFYYDEKWKEAKGFSQVHVNKIKGTIAFGKKDTDHLSIKLIDLSDAIGQEKIDNILTYLEMRSPNGKPSSERIPPVPEVKVIDLPKELRVREEAKMGQDVIERKKWETVKKWANRIKDILPLLIALWKARKELK